MMWNTNVKDFIKLILQVYHAAPKQYYEEGCADVTNPSLPSCARTFSRASSETGPLGDNDDLQMLYSLCIK